LYRTSVAAAESLDLRSDTDQPELLSGYHRLDYRIDRHFTLGRTDCTTSFVEVLNVCDHKNVARYVWNPKTRMPHAERQLGFLPLLGVNVKF
jgi:hypothetical protein